MNILSLNINGLKAFINNGRVFQIEKYLDTDIICFQETKSTFEEVVQYTKEIFPHKVFAVSSNFRKGYAGVATLIDEQVLATEVEEVKAPEIMNEYGSGRIIFTVFHKFVLVNVYTLNSGNKESYRKTWDERFRELIKSLKQVYLRPIVIVGDLNVVGSTLDHWDYDHAKGTMPGLYDFELEGFEKLKSECDLVDTFRLRNPETRAYSWYSYAHSARWKNNGWRIDYTLCSPELLPFVNECNVYSKINASDHCPVYLDLDYGKLSDK